MNFPEIVYLSVSGIILVKNNLFSEITQQGKNK